MIETEAARLKRWIRSLEPEKQLDARTVTVSLGNRRIFGGRYSQLCRDCLGYE